MVGNTLTRFSEPSFLLADVETEGLNLAYSRPWQLAYGIGTLKGGLQSVRIELIRWPGLVIEEDNPSFKHFDPVRYEREARDPREVWAEFAPLLYARKHRLAGHNVLSFDSTVLGCWARRIGAPVDHDFLYDPPVFDTYCLAKAQRMGWTSDISSPEAFVAWQYRCYDQRVDKGIKLKLGDVCRELGVEYDEARAHDAAYDIACNWLVVAAQVKAMDV